MSLSLLISYYGAKDENGCAPIIFPRMKSSNEVCLHQSHLVMAKHEPISAWLSIHWPSAPDYHWIIERHIHSPILRRHKMQHDEVIWGVLDQQFCSFKSKIRKGTNFCRNENSVNGICSRSNCPLANSRYATIREDQGVCYLYMKTIERAHSPKNLWEKVKLSRNYTKALAQVESFLQYWPGRLVHKNKQRLTKIHQYLIRMRKLRKTTKPKMVGVNKKVERRENRREVKAQVAAKLENSIEKELVERLRNGTYGEIYNFPTQSYLNAVDEMEEDEVEGEDEVEYNSEGDDQPEIEFVEDFEEEESDMEDYGQDGGDMLSDFSDDDDQDDTQHKKRRKTNTKPYINVEYEQEMESPQLAYE